MSEAVIACHNLHKTFNDGKLNVAVLKGIDFTISRGESVAILGKSGAGKSTLLQCLGGVDVPSSGNVTIGGQDIVRLTETKRCKLRNQQLGFVYQFHHLLPEFTALENVMMPSLIGNQSVKDARTLACEVIEKVGLAHRQHHKLAELSGGERQRVAIARALINRPACVLADEPTGNLDNQTAGQVIDTMLALNHSSGTALIIVTHDLQLASRMDRVLQIEDGRLQE